MFTQPCFIRKNNNELVQKLSDLGYHYTWYHDGSGIYCFGNLAQTFTFNNELPKECIGCPADNEELFLALAGLRDDTPIGSYYWYKDKLVKCIGVDVPNALTHSTVRYVLKCRMTDQPIILTFKKRDLKKATVEEIVKYFKNNYNESKD